MALATTTTKDGPPQAAPMAPAPMTAAPPVVKPHLIEGTDPVLLVRLYPEAKDLAEMRAQALAAGEATAEAGAKLLASQQEPVAGTEPPPPPPAHKA